MSVSLHQDLLDITLDVLEAVPVALEGPLPPCYPLPLLRPVGRRSHRQLEAVVLENEFLSLTLCPALGGRIVRIFDKRTGLDLLPWPFEPQVAESGPRGACLPWGLELLCGPPGEWPRRRESASVDCMLREPEGDDSPGAVLFYEVVPGLPCSWQAAVTLLPGSASFLVEMQVYNRSFAPLEAESGLLLNLENAGIWAAPGGAALSASGSAWWLGTQGQWSLMASGSRIVLLPDPPASPLLPRETFSWRLEIAPYSGLATPLAATSLYGAGLDGGLLKAVSSRPEPEAEVVLKTVDGDYAAAASLDPAAPFTIDLTRLPEVSGLSVQGVECAFADRMKPPAGGGPGSALRAALTTAGPASAEGAFFAAVLSGQAVPQASLPAIDHARLAAAAQEAMAAKDWTRADSLLDQALLTNGEDVLAWWAKSWAKRRMGAGDERPELLNAHYLSPMEPSLRAESFLQQGALHAREASPLTAPLAKDPDAALDVIHRILESGREDEAVLLMDEILRHEEIPLVRLLLAWLFATRTRMMMEAAQHVRAIEARGLTPPFPWRRLEMQAAVETAPLFPASQPLKNLAALASLAAERQHGPSSLGKL